ncbi:UTP--glucose-1-phosphate uridylyltransferase [Corynebacterium cystitidis]|uniref:UTP--glucose-1-phosphate uridylyltransferase n=1 Tax=Corynebacterium cystitidis DSM 20524 TaxID=1121357 RepID=A0A1H9SV54_9CORY|nr:UTP--glucose-1-phosphate uridylyltransferase [Corynebacterium cystitidis]WJY83200.1 UTP--glucose-1-phosphate uridylyltransferase [Corynebacterium cystitidis DSM 20524]SER88880.1 UDP-glucose pyrophosphorylase [Corynebacterium cystitidis DSM 20524]SNV67451.1 UTP-glucose-1-phosphate uridylyltransferase [Corynebacterium cystitidis]
MDQVPVGKVVVPSAGLGTRMLPFTRSVAKELLPVVNKPSIQLIAEEAAAVGASDLIIVRSPQKQSVHQHFSASNDLVNHLRNKGKDALAQTVENIPNIIHVTNVVQQEPLGLGHAVAQAEELIGDDESFAVALPDDLVIPTDVLAKMATIRARLGGSVLCAIEIEPQDSSKYGIFEVEDPQHIDGCEVRRVLGMVEKPDPADAPSNLAAAGRYVLSREVFPALHKVQPGKGGEIQLTDAIADLSKQGHPVHILVHKGMRLDLGTPHGFIIANVEMALAEDSGLRDLVLSDLHHIIRRETS